MNKLYIIITKLDWGVLNGLILVSFFSFVTDMRPAGGKSKLSYIGERKVS